MKKHLINLIVLFLLSSCATEDELDVTRKETQNYTSAQIYKSAHSEMIKHNWKHAIQLYQVLEANYPYSSDAEHGLLELVYTYYNSDTPELALPELTKFLAIYPASKNMDYALYLQGYIYYYNYNGFLSQLSKQDISERDPAGLKSAYNAFNKLLTEYPNSQYASDARIKVVKLVNSLAKGELIRAEFYMGINAYLAAINHAQKIVSSYSESNYVESALGLQKTCYTKLKEYKLSNDINQVLQLNFPTSIYLYREFVPENKSWYKI